MLKVWHMLNDDDIVSQFDANYHGDYNLDLLANKIGVNHYKINVDNLDKDDQFNDLKQSMGITYSDNVIISPEKFPNYSDKLKIFYAEHLHADDEIRLVLDGSGYFDIRDDSDAWVRIAVEKGDLITLPAGAYHRFTTNEKHFINAMRLFVGDPVWTPLNRPADDHFSRAMYLNKFMKHSASVTAF